MATVAGALVYVFVVLAVAAVVYLLSSLVFGRGEQLAPLPPGATPTRLPARGIEGGDVRGLRFQQVVRGYKAAEVDWALDRLAGELDELRGQVAVLERQLDVAGEELHRSRGPEQVAPADPGGTDPDSADPDGADPDGVEPEGHAPEDADGGRFGEPDQAREERGPGGAG